MMMNSAGITAVLVCLLVLPSRSVVASDSSCAHHLAQWLDPSSSETVATEQIFERLQKSKIVLLGESHSTASHHRWQHYMLSALHSRNSNLIVGFEMLPRRVQATLDAWSSGSLDEDEFLKQADWQNVWGYDARYYLPLLHFSRQNRLPAIALNIDRELVSLVGQQGWAALSAEQRMGLSDPAPASEEYRDSLARLYAYKQTLLAGSDHSEMGKDESDLAEIKLSPAFANFVDAQLTWDRAMAEALANAHRGNPGAVVVGIVGRGHLEYGYGIPHQLADMGIDAVDVLLPIGADDTCDPLPANLASAVFVVESDAEEPAPPRARLGVLIENGDAGVRVVQVVEGSVAATAGITEGDLIKAAAGFETALTSELIEIIQRQAAGTWLPIKILRGDRMLELVARFPQAFE